MKKNLLIISINLILLCMVFYIGEFAVWACENIRMKIHGEIFLGAFPLPFHPEPVYFELSEKYFNYHVYRYPRLPSGLEYKDKRPIVVFGCSFAHGYLLNDNQIFTYKLSEALKRPVYNRANNGWGIQHMLYQSRMDGMYETIKDPEYVIYVFIPDHFRRLYSVVAWGQNLLLRYFDLRYKFDGEKLVQITRPPFYLRPIFESYMYLRTTVSYTNNFLINMTNRHEYFGFAREHFKESIEEMKKHWKNTRYIVLFYENFDKDDEFAEILGNLGYEVYYIPPILYNDVFNQEYTEAGHPTEKAWDIIVPELIKEIGIN